MTRKQLLCTFLLTGIFHSAAEAQYDRPENRIWALGNGVGLDFSGGTPTPFRSSLTTTSEGSATVCDTNGQLLFYTNGATVWNRQGNTMPHGINFTGGGTTLTTSTTQGAVIVPVPDSAGKYYIFSLSSVSNCKLYCTRIDMDLDAGAGDVDTSFPLWKVRLDSNLTEKMIAVPGCNNNVWLLVHSDTGTFFKAYEITAAGIDLNPVISYSGNYPADYYRQGVMKASPDRRKLLTCNFRATNPNKAGLEVYDFNYATGTVSNALLIDSFSYYGGSFSPDNSKIYGSTTVVMNSGSVHQFNLRDPDPIGTKTLLGPSGQYADLKIGPDGKIYFGALPGGAGYSNYMYLGRINAPNLSGAACNFQDSVTALRFATTAGTAGALTQGLPNEVAVALRHPDTMISVVLDSLICAPFTPFDIYVPSGAAGYTWEDGSTDSVRTINQRGRYWVTSFTPCPRIDSFIVRGADFPLNWDIRADKQVLSTTDSFDSYQWYRDGQRIDGATGRDYTVVKNGRHSVKVTIGECSDSASYYVNNVSIGASDDQDHDIRIYPNPARSAVFISAAIPVKVSVCSMDGKIVLQQEHTNRIDISSLPAGAYIIRVKDSMNNPLRTGKLIKADL